MEKIIAYKFTKKEAEEALQVCLDDKGIKLVSEGSFYYAESDDIMLDGNEVDERLAQISGVDKGKHYIIEDGLVLLVE